MVRIEPVDTRTADEALLRRLHEYYLPLEAEELPGDDPAPFERFLLDRRSMRADESIPRWVALDGDEVVGSAVAYLNLEQNTHMGFARVNVARPRRGEGIAKALAGPLFDHLETEGRTLIDTYIPEGFPSRAICERAGWKMAYREKRSRLALTALDDALMGQWIDRAAERAADYQLLALKDPFDEADLGAWCELQFQMNTEPREDLEMDDEVLTPAIWRDAEEKLAAAGKSLYSVVAVHRETGQWVGSSSIQTDDIHVAQAWQWETVTHPDHRNKGLGRWMKATNVLRVRDEIDGLGRIDTWNAGSNEPMLNINIAMGFEPILVLETWQGDLASARQRLGV